MDNSKSHERLFSAATPNRNSVTESREKTGKVLRSKDKEANKSMVRTVNTLKLLDEEDHST